MTLILRPMKMDDIPQVVAIDQQAFSTPWSARTYAYEVSEATNSHMLVIDYQPDGAHHNGHHTAQSNGISAGTQPDGAQTASHNINGTADAANGQHRSKSRISSLFNHPEQSVQQRRLNQQETAARRDDTPAVHNPRGWLQRLRPLMPPPMPQVHLVVAYGGLWRIMQEAHISTIASHPDYRGQGYGELALVTMMRRSARMGAGYIVLEVRVSNTIAQNLYHKHGFRIYSTKPRYYRDDNEDAYDMRLEFNDTTRRQIDRRFEALRQRHHLIDRYTEVTG